MPYFLLHSKEELMWTFNMETWDETWRVVVNTTIILKVWVEESGCSLSHHKVSLFKKVSWLEWNTISLHISFYIVIVFKLLCPESS